MSEYRFIQGAIIMLMTAGLVFMKGNELIEIIFGMRVVSIAFFLWTYQDKIFKPKKVVKKNG